jgi:hypothetical protein
MSRSALLALLTRMPPAVLMPLDCAKRQRSRTLRASSGGGVMAGGLVGAGANGWLMAGSGCAGDDRVARSINAMGTRKNASIVWRMLVIVGLRIGGPVLADHLHIIAPLDTS